MAMLLVSSACAFATPDRTGKTDLGLQVGGLLPIARSLDNGPYYQARVSYSIKDWVAVGVEAGYENAPARFVTGATEVHTHINHVPVFADIILRATQMENTNVVPYGVLGVGELFSTARGIADFTDANLKLNIDNSFAFKLGAGVEWFKDDQWAVTLEGSYVWAASDAKLVNMKGVEIDSASMNYWTLVGGIKYLFD